MTVRIKFNEAGFRELLTSAGAYSLLEPHAERMKTEANAVPSTTEPAATEPYYEIHKGGYGSNDDRARVQVQTTSDRAAKHEAKTGALQAALGGTVHLSRRTTTTKPSASPKKASKSKGRWTAEEYAAIFSGTAAEVAARTGRSEGAVIAQRQKLGRRK